MNDEECVTWAVGRDRFHHTWDFFKLFYTDTDTRRLWPRPDLQGGPIPLAEFDRFHIVKIVPRTSTTRFMIAYTELDGGVYIICRAQERANTTSDAWKDLPNRILFALELAPDIIEGLMEASTFDASTLETDEITDELLARQQDVGA